MRTPITITLLLGIASCVLVLLFAVPARDGARAGGGFHSDPLLPVRIGEAPPDGWTFDGPSDDDPSRRFRFALEAAAEDGEPAFVEVSFLAASAEEAGFGRSELFARERNVVQQHLAEARSVVVDRHVRLGSLGDADCVSARGTGRDGRDCEMRSYVVEREGLLAVYRIRGDASAIAARRDDLDRILRSVRIGRR